MSQKKKLPAASVIKQVRQEVGKSKKTPEYHPKSEEELELAFYQLDIDHNKWIDQDKYAQSLVNLPSMCKNVPAVAIQFLKKLLFFLGIKFKNRNKMIHNTCMIKIYKFIF